MCLIPTDRLVSDYIAWRGRFCAFDFASFERFMTYIFAQVLQHDPGISDPWDTNITIDALGACNSRKLLRVRV